MKEAINKAKEEKDRKQKESLEKSAKTYGSLCHNFPLMVLKSGLSQAVAFVWVKAQSKGKEKSPQAQFLRHLAELVKFSPSNNPSEFQNHINGLELMEYQRYTRKILAASIWYKRFAESILDVKAGEEVSEDIYEDNETGENQNA